jgi:hypothetical protein
MRHNNAPLPARSGFTPGLVFFAAESRWILGLFMRQFIRFPGQLIASGAQFSNDREKHRVILR